MTQHESVQPTPLLERMRRGEVADDDPALAMVSNLALFLRLRIRDRIDDILLSNGREQSTPTLSASERLEIAITGLQLAVEAVVEDLNQDAEQSAITRA